MTNRGSSLIRKRRIHGGRGSGRGKWGRETEREREGEREKDGHKALEEMRIRNSTIHADQPQPLIIHFSPRSQTSGTLFQIANTQPLGGRLWMSLKMGAITRYRVTSPVRKSPPP